MTERVLEHGHLLWAGADFRRILGHNKPALPICGGEGVCCVRVLCVRVRAERRGQSPRPTAKSKWEFGGGGFGGRTRVSSLLRMFQIQVSLKALLVACSRQRILCSRPSLFSQVVLYRRNSEEEFNVTSENSYRNDFHHVYNNYIKVLVCSKVLHSLLFEKTQKFRICHPQRHTHTRFPMQTCELLLCICCTGTLCPQQRQADHLLLHRFGTMLLRPTN